MQEEIYSVEMAARGREIGWTFSVLKLNNFKRKRMVIQKRIAFVEWKYVTASSTIFE